MKVKLTDIIIKSAHAALKKQRGDGSFTAGTNGPWQNKDTPVRVTAHWAITFSYAYKITKDEKFKRGAINAGKFLLSSKCRPGGYAFYCRKKKDRGNGLIGQAWVVESLVTLYETFGYQTFLKAAEDVLLKHHFDETLGLWKELNINGGNGVLKRTINQHIMFLYVTLKVAKLTGNKTLKERVEIALNKLHENIESNSKHILHGIHNNFKNKHLKKAFRKTSRFGISIVLPKSKKVTREYLSFTLFGLSLLKREEPQLKFWVGYKKHIDSSLQFVQENLYKQKTHPKNFSWSYNPTGFEIALAIETFGGVKKEWIKTQVERHFDFKTGLMNKDTYDPNTLAARIYEATYLTDLKLDL